MNNATARTTIVATVGPASSDPQMLEQLVCAGVNVFRLNFSHGKNEEHLERLNAIRAIAARHEKSVAVLQDLPGPKIRLGQFRNGEALLEPGTRFVLDNDPTPGDAKRCAITYSELWKDVQKGQRILLADGVRELRVLSMEEDRVETEVVVGGVISDRKGVNLPETRLRIPALTEKDRESLLWGIEHGVDYMALSFVRTAEDLQPAREALQAANSRTPLIAKIEKPEAIRNLDSILDAADGVMVARGDLGVEMVPEKVPALQKEIILKANEKDKIVITATQMLESMIENPRPTRAEASDVANAIYDGTDAIMLSGETAVGKYPVQAVEMMRRIALETEGHRFQCSAGRKPLSFETESLEKLVSHMASEASRNTNTRAICAFTCSGFTARLIAKFRPPDPIYALTPDETTLRQMALVWGVQPILVPEVEDFEGVLKIVNETFCKRLGFQPGDVVVVVCGLPVPVRGTTNTVRLHVLQSA